MTEEMRERVSDELDYEHEAQQHRAFARSWRGHPFIYVPPVVTELCSEHVLVSEWVEAKGFEDVRAMDRATRDRFGEIVFRFFFGSLYRNGHFSGDPHPGNFKLMEHGRVGFLDFGMTKRLPRDHLEREIDGHVDELEQRIHEVRERHEATRRELADQLQERERERRAALKTALSVQSIGTGFFVLGVVLSVLGNVATC